MDAITIDTKKKFDCIYSNKVLQHLNNDELIQSLHRQMAALNENGIICHSFWKGEDCYEMDGALFNHHLEENLDEFFSSHFEILVLDSYSEMEEDDSILLIGKLK